MKIQILHNDYFEGANIKEEIEMLGGGSIIPMINLKNYEPINADEADSYYNGKEPKEGEKLITLYAHIHGEVKFSLSKTCQWDSGVAGFLLVDEKIKDDDIKTYLEHLNALWNGTTAEVNVIEEIKCDCCGNVKYEEHIDASGILYTFDEIEDSIRYFKDKYKIKDEDVEDLF